MRIICFIPTVVVDRLLSLYRGHRLGWQGRKYKEGER